MANYKVRYNVTVGDIDGNIAVTGFSAGAQGDTAALADLATQMAAFVAVLGPATNGKILRQSAEVLFSEAQIIPGSTPPTDAVYPTVTDGARLNFSNSEGAAAHITVPAPVEAMFLAAPQRNYVDAGASSVGGNLVAFLKTAMEDVGGNLLNLYQGGIKVGRGARVRRPPKAGLS